MELQEIVEQLKMLSEELELLVKESKIKESYVDLIVAIDQSWYLAPGASSHRAIIGISGMFTTLIKEKIEEQIECNKSGKTVDLVIEIFAGSVSALRDQDLFLYGFQRIDKVGDYEVFELKVITGEQKVPRAEQKLANMLADLVRDLLDIESVEVLETPEEFAERYHAGERRFIRLKDAGESS